MKWCACVLCVCVCACACTRAVIITIMLYLTGIGKDIADNCLARLHDQNAFNLRSTPRDSTKINIIQLDVRV